MRLLIILATLTFFAPSLRAATADFGDFDRRAKAGERLSVVFFGASLTWGANASDPMQTSYRAVVSGRLEAAYPDAHFKFHDAAIGGTNSQLGVFRLQRDVLRHQPDLVFLDFSANDDIMWDVRRGTTDRMKRRDAHHAQVVAVGLDASQEHTLEIRPLFTGEDEQELRLESICVAGGAAEVRRHH